jgi:hypothetical protein
MRYLIGVGLGLMPLLVVVALLGFAAWRDRRRERVLARQIRLTDAIAGELGAIVAPTVDKPVLRPWRVRMAVPLGRPAVVGRILAITQATLDRVAGEPYEIVLSAQPRPAAAARLVPMAPRRQAA